MGTRHSGQSFVVCPSRLQLHGTGNAMILMTNVRGAILRKMVCFGTENARGHCHHIRTVPGSVSRFSTLSAHCRSILSVEVLLCDPHVKLSFTVSGRLFWALRVNDDGRGRRRVRVFWDCDLIVWITWLWRRALFIVQKHHLLGISLYCLFTILGFLFLFSVYS